MIYGIKVILKYLLKSDHAGRNFAVYPDDTFIVSYPRSGNTWTRFLIANLVYPNETITFNNIERLIPDTSSQASRVVKRTPRPRIIKTHEYFDPRYRKTIYIVRDPRDVVLSYYDFQRKYRHIEDGYPLDKYVNDFISGSLISWGWGTWGENVASWVAARGNNKNFLLLRYEDMIQDTAAQLTRIAAFLDLAITRDLLEKTVEKSSAEQMRKLEKLQSQDWIATKNRRPDIPFVRTATSGGWKHNLSEHLAREIESAWGDLMLYLGYTVPTSTGIRHAYFESREAINP